MQLLKKRVLPIWLTLVLCVTLFCGVWTPAQAATVDYVYSDGYVYNWGTREELATFLSPMAEDWYEENDTSYAELSTLPGSSSTSSVPSSALYQALHALMYDNLDNPTSYDVTRDLFKYTDCQNNGKTTSAISSFYSGAAIGPAWDSGKTWNREHTWPNSKSTSTNSSNTRRETDIMMLRPASVSENSGRSNTAYGEGNSYYDPNKLGQNVRGDVARIVLYVYTCWGGNSTYADGALDYMWGSSGVIESKAVLLKWMQEDPVDTWEMGRNDAVQSITGTRNVFVDYPELAFDLFNTDVPTDYSTPSNGGSGSGPVSYTISASVNNSNSGTAYVSGNTIIATPAAGYVVSSYTILSGTATVVRDGNVFTITPNSDVSIKINFSANAEACTSTSYVFSDYAAGTQYAQGEVHQLDSKTQLIVNKGWLTSQLRLYSSTSYNANAVIATTGPVSAITLGMAMYADSVSDTLNVFTSETDTVPQGIAVDTNVYKDYYLSFAQPTDYIKMDVAGTNQMRIQSITLVFAHMYTNACDATCDSCGAARTPSAHVYDNDMDNDCNECGAVRVTDTPNTPVGSGTATITFDTTDKRTTCTTTQQVWVENGITVTNDKGSSTSNVADYAKPARFYKNSTLTVAYPGMTAIAFHCNTAAYATALADSIDGAEADGTVVTVTVDNADNFVCTLTGGQVRMDSITITYNVVESCKHPAAYGVAGKEATCAADGYTAGVYCPDCDAYISGHEEIPATGEHTYDNGCDATCNTCGGTRTPDDHVYTAACDEECDVCGAVRTVTAGGEATITFDSTSKRTEFSTSKQVWTENGITVTNNKGSSTSNVANYANPARFYKSSTLIVEYPGMTSIVFTCNTEEYAAALKNSIGNGAAVSGKVVTVALASVDVYTIQKLSGGQVRMDSITVTVAGASHAYASDADAFCNTCHSWRTLEGVCLYSEEVPNSRMEMSAGVGGLAYKYELGAVGVTVNDRRNADLSAATITYGDTAYRLVGMGAVITNDAAKVDNLTLDAVNKDSVIDIPALILFSVDEDYCSFAVRITNIPERHYETAIYARPYCIIECEGTQFVVYDPITVANYANTLN